MQSLVKFTFVESHMGCPESHSAHPHFIPLHKKVPPRSSDPSCLPSYSNSLSLIFSLSFSFSPSLTTLPPPNFLDTYLLQCYLHVRFLECPHLGGKHAESVSSKYLRMFPVSWFAFSPAVILAPFRILYGSCYVNVHWFSRTQCEPRNR